MLWSIHANSIAGLQRARRGGDARTAGALRVIVDWVHALLATTLHIESGKGYAPLECRHAQSIVVGYVWLGRASEWRESAIAEPAR